MSDHSQFHYSGKSHPFKPDYRAQEPIYLRREFPYRGLILQRGEPSAGYMWNIYDLNKEAVQGLGGSFTKAQLAQDAVDRWIEDRKGFDKEFTNDENKKNN